MKKKIDFHLEIRTYAGTPGVADVWIIERDGAALSGLLHGFGHLDRIERLAEKLASVGIEVKREEAPFKLSKKEMGALLPFGSTSREGLEPATAEAPERGLF